MVVGTTGAFAGGEAPLVNGTNLAVEELNAKGGIKGRRINLAIEDTGSEQTGAVNAFNRIIGQDPVAIMDTTLSGFVLSQIGMIQDEGIPPHRGRLGAARPTRRAPSPVPGSHQRRQGTGGRGALRHRDAWRKDGWSAARQQRIRQRLAHAIEDSLASSGENRRRELRRYRPRPHAPVAADQERWRRRADRCGDPPNQVVAVQQIKQLGLGMKVILSNAGVLPTTVKLYQPEASNGIFGTVNSFPADDPANKDWADRYRKAFNIEPDYSAAEYYDGVMMAAAAIEKVGTDKAALVKELRTLRSTKGVGNTYTYADKGDGGETVAIVQIENGKLKLSTVVK